MHIHYSERQKELIISSYKLIYINTYRDPTQEIQRMALLNISGLKAAENQLPSGLTLRDCLKLSALHHADSHTLIGDINASLPWWCGAELSRENMRAKVQIRAKWDASNHPMVQRHWLFPCLSAVSMYAVCLHKAYLAEHTNGTDGHPACQLLDMHQLELILYLWLLSAKSDKDGM